MNSILESVYPEKDVVARRQQRGLLPLKRLFLLLIPFLILILILLLPVGWHGRAAVVNLLTTSMKACLKQDYRRGPAVAQARCAKENRSQEATRLRGSQSLLRAQL